MVTLRPNTVKHIDANEVASEFTKWCDNKSDCLYKNKKRTYHGWINLDRLSQKDKTAQCGWDNGDCNHTTHHGIGGYHNICPIGGFNGDKPWPAKLQCSDFSFTKNGITSSAKIKSVTVSFEHRMVAIDTGTGTIYDNFGPTFHKNKDSWVNKIYFTNNNNKVSDVKYNDNNPKLSKSKFNSVTVKFTDVTVNELLNSKFALNIEYNHNHNTNPGIIYIRNIKITVDYDNATKYITSKNNASDIVYTSDDNSCRTTITQTVEAGYKRGTKKIPVNDAPAKLGDKIQVATFPENVVVTEVSSTDSTKIFEIQDNTGIAGEKSITYNLSDDSKTKIQIKYTAKTPNKPDCYIQGEYKYNEDFDPAKSYLIVKNGCASTISIYFDSIDSTPLVLNTINDSKNMLDTSSLLSYHNQVKALSCGWHEVYIRRGNEPLSYVVENNKRLIKISPMNYQFKIYSDTNADFKFTQSKTNAAETIKIKRVDNEPRATIPKIYIQDDTKKTQAIESHTNIKQGDVVEHQISKKYAGQFLVSVYEGDTPCPSQNKSRRYVIVEPSHKQNYDYLFTRVQNGIGLDVEYLVAWEGDNIATPLGIAQGSDIVLYNTEDTIRICSKDSQSGLSQIETIPLRIRNTKNEKFTNIRIELNALSKNDDGTFEVSTGEWTDNNGVFAHFYDLFNEFNALNKNVEIQNLTPDNDLVDEENVYILIKELNPLDTVEIKLPFRSFVEKNVRLQFLLFEEPQTIYDYDSCNTPLPNNFVNISVFDSILTQINIQGETDLLNLDNSFKCPTECYTTKQNNNPQTGLTYEITNIDTVNVNEKVKTRIENSAELQPYGYSVDGHYYNFFDTEGNRIDVQEQIPARDYNGNVMYDANQNVIYQPNKIKWTEETVIVPQKMVGHLVYAHIQFPEAEEQIMIDRSDKNGIASFYITIPTFLNRTYTLTELLQQCIYFDFKETELLNGCRLTKKSALEIIPPVNGKTDVVITAPTDYRRYGPGDIIHIPVTIESQNKVIHNYIDFYADIGKSGHSDKVTVMYKICNLENNEGVFKTTFKTNDIKLIPNEISKDIYCGITTDIELKSKIERYLVESDTLNVIHVDITNGIKHNKDVKVVANLGQIHDTVGHTYDYSGDYSFIDINIDEGDYAITTENNNVIVTWLIGQMNPKEQRKGIIKIKAENIGLSDIQVSVFDYIHAQDGTKLVKQNQCPQCTKPKTYTIKNSPYKKFGKVWYKEIDGVYKRRVYQDDKYIWVNKND